MCVANDDKNIVGAAVGVCMSHFMIQFEKKKMKIVKHFFFFLKIYYKLVKFCLEVAVWV